MGTNVLKKRLNTYKSGKGNLTRVEDEVVMDVLRIWEQWQGSSADLYRELGISKTQLAFYMGRVAVQHGKVADSGHEYPKFHARPLSLHQKGGVPAKLPRVHQWHCAAQRGSQGCVRISDAFNRQIDLRSCLNRHSLDAPEDDPCASWLLFPTRRPVRWPGSYLIIGDSTEFGVAPFRSEVAALNRH